MMKRKMSYPKAVLDSGVLPRYDRCQTPPYSLDPIMTYLAKFPVIWEPAAGEGNLAIQLKKTGHEVYATDIIGTSYSNVSDFFEKELPLDYDAIVTNPPYSLKYDWIERCYELGKPWALLMPVETMGSSRAQKMFSYNGVEVMLLDKRINFDMPNKHYEGSAQFPVAWFTWRVLPEPIMYGHIERW